MNYLPLEWLIRAMGGCMVVGRKVEEGHEEGEEGHEDGAGLYDEGVG
jgi:hypothetical protein